MTIFVFGLLTTVLMIWYFKRTILLDKNPEPENEHKNTKINILDKYPKNYSELWQKAEEQKNTNAHGSTSIHGQNQLYSWLVFIIAICYSMPAIQIVIQQQQITTGISKSIDYCVTFYAFSPFCRKPRYLLLQLSLCYPI